LLECWRCSESGSRAWRNPGIDKIHILDSAKFVFVGIY